MKDTRMLHPPTLRKTTIVELSMVLDKVEHITSIEICENQSSQVWRLNTICEFKAIRDDRSTTVEMEVIRGRK